MKGLLLLMIMASSIALNSFAQDTIYVDKYARWTDKENAVEYAVATKIDKELTEVKYYELDDKLKRIENCNVFTKKQTFRQGRLTQFYPSGKVRREEYYDKNKCIVGKLWAEDGSELPFKPYYENIDFPGGLTSFPRQLMEVIKYPEEAVQQGIQGKVAMQFIIDTKGRITKPEILSSPHPLLSNAVLNAIKELSKKWVFTPAKIEGKKIPTTFITFPAFHLPQK